MTLLLAVAETGIFQRRFSKTFQQGFHPVAQNSFSALWLTQNSHGTFLTNQNQWWFADVFSGAYDERWLVHLICSAY